MNLFEKLTTHSFNLSNNYEQINTLKKQFDDDLLEIKQLKNGILIFKKSPNLTVFFLDKISKLSLPKTHFKLLFKSENQLKLYDEFIKINDFYPFHSFRQMQMKIPILKESKFSEIEFAKESEVAEVYEFFTEFFPSSYLFDYTSKMLLEKIKKQEVLVYKENDKISSALIFTQVLNNIFIDFIATKAFLKFKYSALAMMEFLCVLNQQYPNLKLFVGLNNEKAINFYRKFGFEFNNIYLNFYRNYK